LGSKFWQDHPVIYDYIKTSYLEHTDEELSKNIKSFFGIDINAEKIRWLRRDEEWKKREIEAKEKFERVVFIGDFHIPFHDYALFSLFLKFLKFFKPHKLFILGDLLDCYSISNFDKDPKRIASLQEEVDLGIGIIERIQQYVKDITFLEGNHEARLEKHLRRNPELFGLRCLKIESLLGLPEKHIPYYSYLHPPIRYHKLKIHHSFIIRKHSGWTAKANFERYGGCGIIGHAHRSGSFVVRNMEGTFGWYENPCMCSLDAEYLDFTNWTQGFSIAYFSKKDLFHLEQVPVIKHKFIFNGRLFTSIP